MKTSRLSALTGVFLTAVTPALSQTAAPEFNADFGASGTVAVDCDLLTPAGTLTSAFIMQLDPLGHYGDTRKIVQQERVLRQAHGIPDGEPIPEDIMLPSVIRHIGLHGISEERINGVAQLCRDQF